MTSLFLKASLPAPSPSAKTPTQDPRQYVPASGQTWTSLHACSATQKNAFETDALDPRIHYLTTSPVNPASLPPNLSHSATTRKPLGIGQRAILLQTENGNILWDLIAFLDEATVDFIREKGGLKAIVISHPHFYTTHLEWANIFACPVYMCGDDEEWLCREDRNGARKLIKGVTEILPGVTAIQAGGHFDGSMFLHWEKKLFLADTIMSAPVRGVYALFLPSFLPSYSSNPSNTEPINQPINPN